MWDQSWDESQEGMGSWEQSSHLQATANASTTKMNFMDLFKIYSKSNYRTCILSIIYPMQMIYIIYHMYITHHMPDPNKNVVIFQMSQSQHNAVVLKKNNQARFTQLWSMFAKSQPNAMRLSQFMQFVIDRCLVSNRTTLKHFYQLFIQATQRRNSLQPSSPANINILIQRNIQKMEFVFLLNELGKHVYHNDKNQQDRVYHDLLGQKSIAEKDSVHYSRVMIMDEINRKMMMENAVKALSTYEDQMAALYLVYVQQNYWSLKKQGRILLTRRQVQLQNKRMSAVSFIRFLKQAQVLPHLINIEHVDQILSRVVPGTNPRENQFYYKHFLVDVYSKDMDNAEIKHDGDPGLLLFEFMITIARIAVQTSKEVDNAKKAYDYIITKFLGAYLSLRNNEEIHKKPLQNASKGHLNNLRKYYTIIEKDHEHQDVESEKPEQYNPFEVLKERQAKMDHMEPLQFNIPNMMRTLQAQLPPLPEQIVIKQELVPPFAPKFKDVPKVTIGQQPPPQKVDKNKNSQKPAPKKQQLKKGEKPPRVFKYMDPEQQTKKIQTSQDYFQKLATELDYSLKPLSSLERGNIPLDPFPSIISQILYPGQIPENVLPFIQAGLNAHNEGGYALALQNYQKAYKLWKSQTDLSPSLEIFFQFTKGGVYLSAGKDDYAFNCYYNCRNWLEKMAYLNPDRALPYCGLGEVLYGAEQYELAARAYLKAREIRQTLLGVESVDTATVFNNLGCCFFMLDRSKQALSYFKIAKQVLIAELGEFHERSQTSRENVTLCQNAFFSNTPQYRKLWQVFEKDPFGKKKKKKKKDGKK